MNCDNLKSNLIKRYKELYNSKSEINFDNFFYPLDFETISKKALTINENALNFLILHFILSPSLRFIHNTHMPSFLFEDINNFSRYVLKSLGFVNNTCYVFYMMNSHNLNDIFDMMIEKWLKSGSDFTFMGWVNLMEICDKFSKISLEDNVTFAFQWNIKLWDHLDMFLESVINLTPKNNFKITIFTSDQINDKTKLKIKEFNRFFMEKNNISREIIDIINH